MIKSSEKDNKSNIYLSIVIPVYQNEHTLGDLYKEIQETVINRNSDRKIEVIFVDDGSTDNSLKTLYKLKQQFHNDRIKIITLTRNFGQVPAIHAGYELSEGEYIVNISADLQDPPELINEMIQFSSCDDFEVVICTRDSREDPLVTIFFSRLAYWMMKKLSFKEMPLGGFDYVLISKNVMNTILSNPEANPFFQGQILWTGFKTKFIPYQRRNRQIGRSQYTFSRKLKYLIDGILGYSYTPIRLISILGLIFSFSGFLYAIIIIINWFLGDSPFQGWSPLMLIILLSSGFQMLMIGIIGEYIWRTLDQVRNRPPYIIHKIIE